jgi:hypothetical protein
MAMAGAPDKPTFFGLAFLHCVLHATAADALIDSKLVHGPRVLMTTSVQLLYQVEPPWHPIIIDELTTGGTPGEGSLIFTRLIPS